MLKTKPRLRVDDKLLADSAERAAEAFKDHVITQHLDQGMYRSWRCKKPGTWCYGFDVTTTPGFLFLTGDIGELIVERANDMICWASSAIRDPHYFAEKVPHAIPTKEWSYDKSLEWIDEEMRDAKDEDEEGHASCPKCGKLVPVLISTGAISTHDWPPGCRSVCPGSKKVVVRKHILTNLRGDINGEMSEHEFCTALHESGLIDSGDWPNLKVFNANFLWCYQAVKWFLAHLPEEVAAVIEQAESGNA